MFSRCSSSFLRLAPKSYPRSIHKYVPLNIACVVGVAHDLQFGFLPNDDPCLQFMLSHNVLDQTINTSITAAAVADGPASSLAKRTPQVCAKQQLAVRVVGPANLVGEARQTISDGAVLRVVGQLKINVQSDNNKKHPFPFLMCQLSADIGTPQQPSVGSFAILSGRKLGAAAKTVPGQAASAPAAAAVGGASSAAAVAEKEKVVLKSVKTGCRRHRHPES